MKFVFEVITHKYLDMKRISLIKKATNIAIMLLVVALTANAQRRGEAAIRGGGGNAPIGHAATPAPSNGGGNNYSSNVPPVSAPSRSGSNTPTTYGNYQNAHINTVLSGGRGNNYYSSSSNRPINSSNGYYGNAEGRYHGGYYGHGGGGYYNGGYHGYGYRGYNLDVFSPYAIYPFYPTLGLRLSWLPFGYYSFYYDGFPYYYYNSVFYRRTTDEHYEIVSPPLGARVTSIPNTAKAVVINGNKYYESNGTYYQEELDSNSNVVYHVVGTNGELNQPKTPQVVYEPQIGDIVPQLPANSTILYLNGQLLFESPDNVYYQEVLDGDRKAYKIVGK